MNIDCEHQIGLIFITKMNSKWIKIRHLFSFVNQNNNSQRFIQNLYLSTTAKNNNDDDDPR